MGHRNYGNVNCGLIWKIAIFLGLAICGCSVGGAPSPPPSKKPVPAKTTSPEGFKPPNALERSLAMGSDAPTFFLTMESFFEPIKEPTSRDWLADHQEKGQTYPQYEALEPNMPRAPRDKIYLLPLGEFSSADPSLEKIQDYTTRFFGLEVVLLEGETNPTFTGRTDLFTKKKQWLTSDILSHLETKLPEDAYCLLGVTMTDLYPSESWNYVFGIATLKKRVGVYSLARYDPQFFGNSRGEDWDKKALERSCKVLAHETCHMMGMAHCIYFDCLMNGTNHLDELDGQNTFLCPVCLRKLQRAVRPDFLERYRHLKEFFEANGLEKQRLWVSRVLES